MNCRRKAAMNLEEFMALKLREEAKRQACLERRFSAAERWRWQQQALASLAELRTDLKRRQAPSRKDSANHAAD